MAGDWIMMRLNLGEDEDVYAMSAALNLSRYEIIGRLHKLWAWADQHTTDGVVRKLSATWMDTFVEAPGFFDSMYAIPWIEKLSEGGFKFINFDTWNGSNAKKRQKDNRRKANDRKKKTTSAKRPRNVRDLSAKVPQNLGRKTGPEKRREENIYIPIVPLLDDTFQTPEFDSAWKDFCTHRESLGKRLSDVSVSRIAAKLKPMGVAKAIEALGNSIEAGWTGVFAPKADGGKAAGVPGSKFPKTAEEFNNSGRYVP